MAHTFIDTEFGAIRVKRVHAARHVRLRIAQDGTLVATLPKRAPIRLVQELVNHSRDELREIVVTTKQKHERIYTDGQQIGASHTLRFIYGDVTSPAVKTREQVIEVTLPTDSAIDSLETQAVAKKGVAKALRKEAGAYLPRRLSYLAEQNGFRYESVRFSNAKGRWGSCSSTGTISLNIALMNLPPEIIDYILIHELCHTREMNHSTQFWEIVERICPDYKDRRRALKSYAPYL